MNTDDFVVGLDIGTSKICALVGERVGDGEINIRGVGITSSKGLRKGMVVNLESTVDSIGRAVEEAERKAGVEITKVYAGIAGGHIRGMESRGVVAVSGSEVQKRDVDRAVDAAKAVALPIDREVIHVLPQEFIVDEHGEIKDPVGMPASRLEVAVHIVTGAVASAQNIISCVNRTGFEVEDIILQPLASARAVLTEDEKNLGVILIDIGGGTTDIIVMSRGAFRHTQILALGGDHVTNDLAVGLHVSTSCAEELKKTRGCALRRLVPEESVVRAKGVRNGISRGLLCEIIEMRMEETLALVHQEVEKTGLSPFLGAGVVLTGGASLLSGIQQMAESIFDMPVRIGKPERGVSGLEKVGTSPIYATAVGLVQHGFERAQGRKIRFAGRNLFAKVARRMTEWFMEFS
jgi:cell division protein FtsA